MSSFMCSETHINALATFAAKHLVLDASAFAKNLTLWNELSLRVCYSDPSDMLEGVNAYSFRPVDLEALAGPITVPTFIIKLADCYAYQACEDDSYDDSHTAKHVEAIIERAKALGGVTEGEAYDAAPWGL
jgi:hypothetical protein